MSVSKASRRQTTRLSVAVLADTEAGAPLATALASIDRGQLNPFEVLQLAQSRERMGNHNTAEFYSDVVAVMRGVEPDYDTSTDRDSGRAAHAEVQAGLVLSRRRGNKLCVLAYDLTNRLPKVHEAMRRGELTPDRAEVFSDETDQLRAEHTEAVIDRLLPTAPLLTTAQLRYAIRREAKDLDPEWAFRRLKKAVAGRRVEGTIGPDGTGQLSGRDLYPDEVAAICARLDAFAHKLKQQGHADPIDHIKADLFCAFLDGTTAGKTDQEVLDDIIATMPRRTKRANNNASARGNSDEGDGHDHETSGDAGRDHQEAPRDREESNDPEHEAPEHEAREHEARKHEPRERGHAGDEEAESAPDSGDPTTDGERGDEGTPGDRGEADGPEHKDGGDAPGSDPDADEPPPAAADDELAAGTGSVAVGQQLANVDVELNLNTHPFRRSRPPAGDTDPDDGEGPEGDGPNGDGGGPGGTGPGGDPDDGGGGGGFGGSAEGGLDPPGDGGLTPDNPDDPLCGIGRINVPVRGRGLRLQTALTTLIGLDRRPVDLLGWGPQPAEIGRRVAAATGASWWWVLTTPMGYPVDVGSIRRRPTVAYTDDPAPTYPDVESWIQFTPDELASLTKNPPLGWEQVIAEINHRLAHSPGGPPNGDPTARLPGAALRRWLHIRDGSCVFFTCSVAPHHCDADHSIAYAEHGPTVDVNLGPLCPNHHDLKTNHGWTVQQPEPGHFIWTSPIGAVYHRRPRFGPHQPHAPMPKATPAQPEPADDHDERWEHHSCLTIVPKPREPEPRPEPRPRRPLPDIPPF